MSDNVQVTLNKRVRECPVAQPPKPSLRTS
jgi:hypothetical protein